MGSLPISSVVVIIMCNVVMDKKGKEKGISENFRGENGIFQTIIQRCSNISLSAILSNKKNHKMFQPPFYQVSRYQKS